MRRFITVAAEQIAELADRSTEDGRMSRARTLFRKGSVTDLVVTEGSIVATVRGSEGDRYEATIATTPAPAHVLAEIVRAHDPGDRWSLDDLVTDGLELCPREIDLAFTCDCADWEEPCKHVAATFLAFADRVDLDQADLLLWRGVDPTPGPASGPASASSAASTPTAPASIRPAPSTRPAPATPSDGGRDADGRRRPLRPVTGNDQDDHDESDDESGSVDRSTRLSELESLLGDTVVRVEAGGSFDPGPSAAATDASLQEFLGIGLTIEPVDLSDAVPPTALFAEVHLGPLADLGPGLAEALAIIRSGLDPT